MTFGKAARHIERRGVIVLSVMIVVNGIWGLFSLGKYRGTSRSTVRMVWWRL